jgi:hypothetical protein
MSDYAPIILFCYKRLASTIQTINSLKNNELAKDSVLYIFSDGPKNKEDERDIFEIRRYLKTITEFKEIIISESKENIGLSNSIINGVSKIIDEYGKVIVMEDDLITSKNFLSFINQALIHYKDNSKVFSISGFTVNVNGLDTNDIYFTLRGSSWGWGTWKDRWDNVDWEVKDYDVFVKDKKARRAFNQMGTDMTSMLNKQMRGQINSWAIRWCYHQFKNSLFTVYPAKSKIDNIGFNRNATHTKGKFNRFKTELDNNSLINTDFNFSDNLSLNDKIIKQFTKPFTISERIKYKLLNALPQF